VSTLKALSEPELQKLIIETFAEPLRNLLNDPQIISTITGIVPVDADAADGPVIVQKLIAEFAFNFIQGHAKQVLASEAEIPASARQFIEENLTHFRSSFDRLAAAIEPLRGIDRKFLNSAYENMFGLVMAAFGLGLSLEYSEEARANFQKMRAKAAQDRNQSKASTRKQEILIPAILKASKGMTLVGSIKFAESIHEETCRIAGVESTARGYSPRTILREIRAILKERPKA
jgi:hypothetical protein